MALLSMLAVSRRLGVAPGTVRKMVARGDLPLSAEETVVCEETGRAQTMRLVAPEAVDEFLEAARVEPGSLRHLYDPEVDRVA